MELNNVLVLFQRLDNNTSGHGKVKVTILDVNDPSYPWDATQLVHSRYEQYGLKMKKIKRGFTFTSNGQRSCEDLIVQQLSKHLNVIRGVWLF